MTGPSLRRGSASLELQEIQVQQSHPRPMIWAPYSSLPSCHVRRVLVLFLCTLHLISSRGTSSFYLACEHIKCKSKQLCTLDWPLNSLVPQFCPGEERRAAWRRSKGRGQSEVLVVVGAKAWPLTASVCRLSPHLPKAADEPAVHAGGAGPVHLLLRHCWPLHLPQQVPGEAVWRLCSLRQLPHW